MQVQLLWGAYLVWPWEGPRARRSVIFFDKDYPWGSKYTCSLWNFLPFHGHKIPTSSRTKWFQCLSLPVILSLKIVYTNSFRFWVSHQLTPGVCRINCLYKYFRFWVSHQLTPGVCRINNLYKYCRFWVSHQLTPGVCRIEGNIILFCLFVIYLFVYLFIVNTNLADFGCLTS